MLEAIKPEARNLPASTLIRAVVCMIVNAVKEGGDLPVPTGTLYGALCDKLSSQQFNQIIAHCVGEGLLSRAPFNRVAITQRGRDWSVTMTSDLRRIGIPV